MGRGVFHPGNPCYPWLNDLIFRRRDGRRDRGCLWDGLLGLHQAGGIRPVSTLLHPGTGAVRVLLDVAHRCFALSGLQNLWGGLPGPPLALLAKEMKQIQGRSPRDADGSRGANSVG